MSPRVGGDAGKAGDRYELLLTAEALLDVIEGSAISVDVESVDDPDGVEFRVTRESRSHTFHQAKRQRAAGQWSIAALSQTGVLATFYTLLQRHPGSRCVFTSGASAGELLELVERARQARDIAHFERLLDSGQQDERWRRLQRTFGSEVSPESALEALRCIYVEAVTEPRLRKTNEVRAEKLLTGNPSAAVDVLAMIAFEARSPLDADAIRSALARRGIARRAATPEDAADAQRQTGAYVETVERARLTDFTFPRRQADEVAQRAAKASVLVIGGAGSGKTTLVRQAAERLEAAGTPVFAMRLDRMTPASSTRAVGEQLGLDTSPVAALARLATERQTAGVLIIDQLDAVSLVSGRRAASLERVSDLLAEAQAFEDVHVLIACREFDLANDRRIRDLMHEAKLEQVKLAAPTADEVRHVLAQRDVDVGRLSADQVETLRSPLLLAVFLQVAGGDRAYKFATPQDIFGLLWDTALDAAGDAGAWLQIAGALADDMSARSTLTAPRPLVDRWSAAARALIGLGVLTEDGERLAFFHESFFDYVYARQFVARGRRLAELLGDGEQLLFRRAQVRQILSYRRATDRGTYLAELRYVLLSRHVRAHIKATALAQLAVISDPSEAEFLLVQRLLEDPDEPLHHRAWDAMRGGRWPQLLDALGLFDRWIASGDERLIAAALALLRSSQEQLRERIPALLSPYFGSGEQWHQRIRGVLSWGELHLDRSLFDLYVRLLDADALDREDIAGGVWLDVVSLAEHEPEWAAEFLGLFYGRRLERGVAMFGEDRRGDGPDESFIRPVAENAPRELLDALLGVALDTADQNRIASDGRRPINDSVWYRRDSVRHEPSEVVLLGLEIALDMVARLGRPHLEPYAERLRNSDLELAQYLLYVAWAAGPQYADEALRHLTQHPTRLKARVSFSDYWQTRRLVETASAHCTEEVLEQFEQFLLTLDPEPDNPEVSERIAQEVQFTLLSAILDERIGEAARQRLDALRGQFGADAPENPSAYELAQFVGPPISEDEARRLDDDQWLETIARFQDDRRDTQRPFEGGATQLAALLQRLAEEDPNRFARIAARLPDETPATYFDHALIALGQTSGDLDLDAVLGLCRRCHQLPDRPCGRWIAWPVARMAGEPLPADILELVGWYATEDPDPEPDPAKDTPDDLISEGINTARGAALRSIAHLIVGSAERLEAFKPALSRAAADPSLAVRACAAIAIDAATAHDDAWAIRTLLTLVAGPDELLAARPVERALAVAAGSDVEAILGVVTRMLGSSVERVRAAGARRAALLALDNKQAQPLLDQAMRGDATLRKNVAGVFAYNLSTTGHRTACESGLATLFDDDDASVRKQAAECFRLLPDDALGEYADLAQRLLDSKAFVDAADQILLACEVAVRPLPDLTVAVCQAWLARLDDIADASGQHLGHDAKTVAELAVRAYSQSTGATQSGALDVVDGLIGRHAYGVDRVLSVAETDR